MGLFSRSREKLEPVEQAIVKAGGKALSVPCDAGARISHVVWYRSSSHRCRVCVLTDVAALPMSRTSVSPGQVAPDHLQRQQQQHMLRREPRRHQARVPGSSRQAGASLGADLQRRSVPFVAATEDYGRHARDSGDSHGARRLWRFVLRPGGVRQASACIYVLSCCLINRAWTAEFVKECDAAGAASHG